MKDNFSVRDWKNQTLFKEAYQEGKNSTREDVGNILSRQEPNVEELQKAVRFHLDAYENGTIDGDDLAQAVEEVVFGKIVAPFTEDQDDEFDTPDNEKGPSAKDIESAESDLEFEIPTSTSASNDMRNIIVKKVAKIEKLRDEKGDYTNDLLALKQYIKRDDVRKEVGASEIRNLVSSLIK